MSLDLKSGFVDRVSWGERACQGVEQQDHVAS